MLSLSDRSGTVDEAQLALRVIGQASVSGTVFLSNRGDRFQTFRKACAVYCDELGQLLNTVRIELLHTDMKRVGTVPQLRNAIKLTE